MPGRTAECATGWQIGLGPHNRKPTWSGANFGSASRGTAPTGSIGTPPALEAVVIGTSTGGPNALTAVLPQIADFPVPLFIVQHMPPVFTARLAERLDQLSAIRVVEAVQGMVVQPGHAYLAPGTFT